MKAWERHWLAALACVGAVVSLAGCDPLEISGVQYLTVAAAEGASSGEVVVGLRQQRTGRIALEYSLENTGPTEARFSLQAQVQTAGNPVDAYCAVFAQDTPVDVSASTAPADAPSLRTLRRLYSVALPAAEEGFAGTVLLPLGRESVWRFLSNTEQLSVVVRAADGSVQFPADDPTVEAGCVTVPFQIAYPLADGSWQVILRSPTQNILLLVEEDCAAQRTVPRTCPGQASPILEAAAAVLEPGSSDANRLSAAALGIGDQLVVSLACTAEDGPCAGRAAFVVVTQTLDCQSSTDCSGSDACTSDGYCVAEESPGGCASAVAATAPIPWLLLVAAAAMRRGGWKPRRGFGVAVVTTMLLLARPVAAETNTRSVFLHPAVTLGSYSGQMGAYSSATVAVGAVQGVQFGRIGFSLGLSTEFANTTQPPPPFVRGLQTVQITPAVRYLMALGPVRVGVRAMYRRIAVAQNPLTRYTGPANAWNSLGGGVLLRYDLTALLYVEANGDALVLLNTDTGAAWMGVSLAIGLQSPF